MSSSRSDLPGLAGSRELTVGSLFSGIGGLDVGLERAGMRVSWLCEADPFCRRVLARHWPDAAIYEDVRDVDDRAWHVDVVAGGFPCQPVSVAGRREGQGDARWLWPEFVRVLRLLRPRYVVVENVPGLLTAGFDLVLGDLHCLGFDAEWSLVSACSVGAPHMRDRLFVVAYPQGEGLEGDQPLASGPWTLDAGGHGEGVGRPWADEPRPVGVADGTPDRVDRIRALGNAVVPQVAEVVGRRIVALANASAQAGEAA